MQHTENCPCCGKEFTGESEQRAIRKLLIHMRLIKDGQHGARAIGKIRRRADALNLEFGPIKHNKTRALVRHKTGDQIEQPQSGVATPVFSPTGEMVSGCCPFCHKDVMALRDKVDAYARGEIERELA